MRFDDLILNIISRLDGERYKHAAFHLLKGKRSGQTLQDTEYYRLHPFFGVLPSLDSSEFDRAYYRLLTSGWIAEREDGTVFLTDAGKERSVTLPITQLNGWAYRGREKQFFARLALTVQTVSHLAAGDRTFMPVITDPAVQRDVRTLFRTILRGKHPEQIAGEIRSGLAATGMEDGRLSRLVARLTGKGMSGMTWRQLSETTGISEMDLKVEWVESLHILLDFNSKNPTPLFSDLAQGTRTNSPLTDSAKKTEVLYRAGMSMQQITERRNLKMSTIEDHYVEIAINDRSFPLEDFMKKAEIEAVKSEAVRLATRKLSLLKQAFPDLSYFQLRLVLARLGKEGESHGHDGNGKLGEPAETGDRV